MTYVSCKADFESPMDRATIALVLSIIAAILAASKWIHIFIQISPTGGSMVEGDWEAISKSSY